MPIHLTSGLPLHALAAAAEWAARRLHGCAPRTPTTRLPARARPTLHCGWRPGRPPARARGPAARAAQAASAAWADKRRKDHDSRHSATSRRRAMWPDIGGGHNASRPPAGYPSPTHPSPGLRPARPPPPPPSTPSPADTPTTPGHHRPIPSLRGHRETPMEKVNLGALYTLPTRKAVSGRDIECQRGRTARGVAYGGDHYSRASQGVSRPPWPEVVEACCACWPARQRAQPWPRGTPRGRAG